MKKLWNAMRRLNETLPYLVVSILLYGGVVQLAGVWFVKNKLSYSIGLWYGIAIAIGMAINLAKVVCDAFDSEKSSKKKIIFKSLLRYFAVVILFLAIGYFKFGNLFTAVIGVFGLKAAAYLTPHVEKLIRKWTGTELPPAPVEGDENSNQNLDVKEVTM